MSEVHKFGVTPIFCHAFNADCSQLAISNENEIHVYKQVNGKYTELVQTLTDHTERVTGIDWAKKTNRLVTCSADRNAYVWTLVDNKWKPTLVILRIDRAATCVKWSPKENKFALGSGSKLVSICHFEGENNWWLSKQIKKGIKSTVTCLDWHPNNVLLAVGSTDYKTRIFCAYIKEVDDKPEDCEWGSLKKAAFHQMLHEWTNFGWVHSVAFSQTGDKLAWICHDSTLCVVDASKGGELTVSTLRHDLLPLTSLMFISSKTMVAAGHDCCPMVFSFNGADQGPKFETQLQNATDRQADSKVSAMKKFQQIDKFATQESGASLETVHQNAITHSVVLKSSGGRVDKMSTVGIDGQLVIWDLRSLEKQFAQLKL